MTDLKVVQFNGHNVRDIPRLARTLAEEIEAGHYGDVQAVALCLETDEGFQVLGWGGADAVRSVGLFTTGSALITTSIMEAE